MFICHNICFSYIPYPGLLLLFRYHGRRSRRQLNDENLISETGGIAIISQVKLFINDISHSLSNISQHEICWNLDLMRACAMHVIPCISHFYCFK